MIAEFTMHWPSFTIGAVILFTIGGIAIMVLLVDHGHEKAAMREAYREDAMRLEQELQGIEGRADYESIVATTGSKIADMGSQLGSQYATVAISFVDLPPSDGMRYTQLPGSCFER